MCMRSGSDVRMRPNASLGEPISQVENCSSSVRSTGDLSWLMVSGERVGQCRHEGIDLDVDVRAALLDRAFPLPINAGEGEQRPLILALQGEPVPASWLAFI